MTNGRVQVLVVKDEWDNPPEVYDLSECKSNEQLGALVRSMIENWEEGQSHTVRLESWTPHELEAAKREADGDVDDEGETLIFLEEEEDEEPASYT